MVMSFLPISSELDRVNAAIINLSALYSLFTAIVLVSSGYDPATYAMRFKEGPTMKPLNSHRLGNWRALWRQERDIDRT